MTSAIELEVIVNKLRLRTTFTGVRCKDELAQIPADTECGIINLNDSDTPTAENKKTGHWTAYFRKDTNNYYFCSYGSPPPLALVEYLGKPVHTHTFQIQDFGSNICGELACLWLLLMDRGFDYFDAVLTLVGIAE
jgi:hypothetical protein